MQIFKKILLICAGAIIVLHSLVPHQHGEEYANEGSITNQSTTNIFDYISLVFHFNLGEHHLENFLTPEADIEVDTETADFNLLTFYLFEKISLQSVPSINFTDSLPPQIKEQLKTRTDQFRGPPTLS